MKELLYVPVFLTFLACLASVRPVITDSCISRYTCGECIRVPNCVWCSETNVDIKQPRCQSRTQKVNCSSNFIVDPTASSVILEDQQFSNSSSQAETMTLRPLKVSVTNLRVGESFNVSLQFKVIPNYPADLYYLMDVSYSMYYDKQNLVLLGESLANTMRNITSDFQIGFGSFVDKNEIPFIARFVNNPTESCGPEGIRCITYSFRNELSLSTNVDEFTKAVNATAIIQTFDTPEGGFDALLQAAVCKNQIGWRDKSRRLIVFATDAPSHLAGNGKIGGVIKPNDGKCHLDSRDGMYTEAIDQDYPSLGQISRVIKENSISVIFAVTENVQPGYKEFSRFISGSQVGILDENSENIVDLIRDIYQDIASSVELKDTAGPDVKVTFYSDCGKGQIRETNKCDSLKLGDIIDFTINIEVTNCPVDEAALKQTVEVYPVGVNEAVILELELICNCPCEKPGNPGYIVNAPQCNNGGNLECGICNCDGTHSGEKCECSADATIVDPLASCSADNSSDVLCSDRGDCVCGKCNCYQRPNPLEVISGTYCECDNFSCPRVDELLCSGHGECNCGECQCESGWSGTACDCSTSNEMCMPYGGGEICSGNGGCECGKCVCSFISQGTFCQDCPTCPSKCDEFQPCVQCKAFGTGPYITDKTCEAKCTYPIKVEDELEMGDSSERYCSYQDGNNCKVEFFYGYESNGGRRVRVARYPVCPPGDVPVLALSLGLLGAIVLLGLLGLIVFRIITWISDRREVARFNAEKDKAKWNRDNNPLYVEPFTTFRNPNYNS